MEDEAAATPRAPSGSPARRHTGDGSGKVAAVDQSSFSDLISAHFRLLGQPSSGDATQAYESALAAFQERYGAIQEVYWGPDGRSGVALTSTRSRLRGSHGRVHAQTDVATHDGDLLRSIQDWRILSVKASALRGQPGIQIMQRAFTALSNLVAIALVDRDLTAQAKATLLSADARELAEANAYFAGTAKGVSYSYYFWGMIFGVVCNGTLAFGAAEFVIHAVPYFWNIHISSYYSASAFGCMIAGAMGALLSVLLRMSGDQFQIPHNMGFVKTALIGSFRPYIGAVFGLTFFFAFSAGFGNLLNTSGADKNNFFAVGLLALLSGFSERFSGRIFSGIENTVSGPQQAPTAATTVPVTPLNSAAVSGATSGTPPGTTPAGDS